MPALCSRERRFPSQKRGAPSTFEMGAPTAPLACRNSSSSKLTNGACVQQLPQDAAGLSLKGESPQALPPSPEHHMCWLLAARGVAAPPALLGISRQTSHSCSLLRGHLEGPEQRHGRGRGDVYLNGVVLALFVTDALIQI